MHGDLNVRCRHADVEACRHGLLVDRRRRVDMDVLNSSRAAGLAVLAALRYGGVLPVCRCESVCRCSDVEIGSSRGAL